jgi:hypothetical protein
MIVYDEKKNTAYNNIDIATQLFEQINSLKYIEENPFDFSSRYYQIQEGNVLFVIIDFQSSKDYIEGRAIVSRKNLLPELEQNGELKPLTDIIPSNSGLAETSHFVYFLEKSIIGFETNYYGPRPTQLAAYLQSKANNIIEAINLKPILNLDVENKLKNIREVALLSIEIHKNGAYVLQQLNENLSRAFEAAASFSEAETVEIILRKKKYSKKGFIINQIKDKILNILSDQSSREQFLKFRGDAYYNNGEQALRHFDLLEDKMIVTKKVLLVDKKSKKVNSKSAYSAIIQSYNELHDVFI